MCLCHLSTLLGQKSTKTFLFKSRDIPPKQFDSLVSRDMPNFLSPHSLEDPYPLPENIRTQKFGFVLFFRFRTLGFSRAGKIKNVYRYQSPLFSKKTMQWGKKWPVQMNLPLFAVEAHVSGGVQNQAEKKFEKCLPAGTGTKIYFSVLWGKILKIFDKLFVPRPALQTHHKHVKWPHASQYCHTIAEAPPITRYLSAASPCCNISPSNCAMLMITIRVNSALLPLQASHDVKSIAAGPLLSACASVCCKKHVLCVPFLP